MKIGAEAVALEWFEVHTRYGACEVALNPSSREFKDLYRKLTAPYARYMKKHDGQLPPGKDDEIARECAAHAVLRDWRQIEGPDGEPMEFSPEAAIAAFEDEAVGDQFLAGVMDAARSLWEAYAVELEETAKN